MRLVCPNCDAQYEVAQNAIPLAGRDVQCSNCGHAWFQSPEGTEDAPDARPAPDTPLPPAPDDNADAPAEDPLESLPPAATVPRGIDDALLAVLREEADREVQARRTEAPRVETQTELSLPPAASALTATQRRLAMLKGEDPDAPPPAPPRPTARRDLLPDVEQINSTLRSSSATRDDDEATDALPDLAQPNSAFRSGFVLMLMLAVLVLVAYMAAPRLAEQFPAAAGALNAFVARIDALRGGLDQLMESATATLNSLGG